jgi:hypothetical protein
VKVAPASLVYSSAAHCPAAHAVDPSTQYTFGPIALTDSGRKGAAVADVSGGDTTGAGTTTADADTAGDALGDGDRTGGDAGRLDETAVDGLGVVSFAVTVGL